MIAPVAPLYALLGFFCLLGIAQVVLAGRLVDMIHGGPGRRAPRMRRMDVIVVRVAGGFVLLVAGGALLVVALIGI